MKNILYYKFTKLANLEDLREEHELICRDLGILGKVVLAEEGINGCMSGEDDAIDRYKEYVKIKYGLEDLDIKITNAEKHTFRKLWVKIKPQIIGTKNWDAMIGNKADYITPTEFKKLLDEGQEVVILDARNNYEYDAGHFRGALYPNIRTFSTFHELVKNLDAYKDKTIVSYCTGGIRCEKASAFLKENGFTNIKQLHGGIINYAKKFGSEHWEGKCLVFDNREMLDMDSIRE